MGLRDQAQGYAQMVQEATWAKDLAERNAAAAAEAARIQAYFDLPAQDLVPDVGDHPEQAGRQYDRYIHRTSHEVLRTLVDGIIFRTDQQYFGQSYNNHVEVECSNCGVRCDSRHIDRPWTLSEKDHSISFQRSRTPEGRADFLLTVGRALTTPVLCWDCTLQIPRSCPTCGRRNP